MLNHELNLWHAHQQAIAQVILIRSFSCVFFFILVVQPMICIIAFLVVFNICIEWILSELSFFSVCARHMRSATFIFKSFIDVSLCSVDATHMHRRGFGDQMWFFLWSRLAYASHRARSFSNPTSGLECARHMSILKFNPTPRIFSDLGSTFSTPRPAVTRRRLGPEQFTERLVICSLLHFCSGPICEAYDHSVDKRRQQMNSAWDREVDT